MNCCCIAYSVTYHVATTGCLHFSCGVFVAITAAYWIVHQRLPSVLDWTQLNMPMLRLHMAATLFENERVDLMYGHQRQRNPDYIDMTRDENENSNIYDSTVI